MPQLELPHTAGCLVCGRDNPLGLHLSLHVDPDTGIVGTAYTAPPAHIGFIDTIHGGAIATVLDEAMVWAAMWSIKRACVCAEMTVRFRKPGKVGQAMHVETRVTAARPRLITTAGDLRNGSGEIVAAATGKYAPTDSANHAKLLASLIREPITAEARRMFLRSS